MTGPMATSAPRAGSRSAALRHRVEGWWAADPVRARYVKVMAIGSAVAAVVFAFALGTLLDEGHRYLTNFYDLQARALFHGNLDVPDGALGPEGFVHDGRTYLYFGPFPALLRMPLLLVTDRFDGRITPLMMLLAWLVIVALLALLVWRVRRLVRGDAPLRRAEAVGYPLFLVSAAAGSTILYLASIPWVFQEAYLWAIAMALGVAFALLGTIERPSVGGVVATGAFVLAGILSRATAGYTCAAVVLAAGIWLAVGGRTDRGRPVGRWLLVAALAPVVVGLGINWLKFETFNGFPIREQVFSSLSEHRMAVLDENGGQPFGLNAVPTTALAYFRPDGIRFTARFPFIDAPDEPPTVVGDDVVIDTLNRTPSIVPFMPLLVVLSVWGVVAVVRPPRRTHLAWARLPVLAVAIIPLPVLVTPYVTPRYTAEFVPLLLVAGAIGIVDLCRWLARRPPTEVNIGLGIVAALTVFGVLANSAFAASAGALARPAGKIEDYVARQSWFSDRLGHRLDDVVSASVTLPETSEAGELHIIGDCQALYYGSGESGHTNHPWVEVWSRPLVLQVAVTGEAPPRGSLPLARFSGDHETTLSLDWAGGEYRLALTGGGVDDTSDAFSVEPGRPVELRVDTGDELFYLVQVDGATVLTHPKDGHGPEYEYHPNLVVPEVPSAASAAEVGLAVTEVPPPPDGLCTHLLERYREQLAT